MVPDSLSMYVGAGLGQGYWRGSTPCQALRHRAQMEPRRKALVDTAILLARIDNCPGIAFSPAGFALHKAANYSVEIITCPMGVAIAS